MESSEQVKPSFVKDLNDADRQNKPPTMLDAFIWNVDAADFKQALYQGCSAVNAFPTSLTKHDQAVLLASTEELNKRHRQDFLDKLDQDTVRQLPEIKNRALENLDALLKVNSALKSCKQGGMVAAFLEAQELGYKLTSPAERAYFPVPYLETHYAAILNSGIPKIIALEATSMIVGHRWRRACICFYFLEHFGEFEEVFQRYAPEKIQVYQYASKPFPELLKGGYYKIMAGLYDTTHDDLPYLEECQEEAFIKRQAVLVERPALTPAAEQWVKDKRNALENAYRHQSRETLEQIIQPESAPEKALNGLWYSLACTNLELSFLCRILPAASFLTLADQPLFKLAELTEDETHQAFYELAYNRVLECKDADERQRLFQVDRDEITLGKGWVKFDEETAIQLQQWVQETLTEINQAAKNKSLLTLREILFSKMPLPTRPLLCLKALWFSLLFKGDQMTLSRLQLSQDTPNHEQTVQNHVAINAQPLQQKSVKEGLTLRLEERARLEIFEVFSVLPAHRGHSLSERWMLDALQEHYQAVPSEEDLENTVKLPPQQVYRLLLEGLPYLKQTDVTAIPQAQVAQHVEQALISLKASMSSTQVTGSSVKVSAQMPVELSEASPSTSFYVAYDDFNELQVYFGEQPFLKRGTGQHDIVRELIRLGGISEISEIAQALDFDEDQITEHVKKINSSFKSQTKSTKILIQTKKPKLKLCATLRENWYPTST